MQTINAQTIINELAALALAAPEEVQAAYNAPGYWVTVKTSERGTARLVNQKSNIEIYAAKVRKNATAFGGGLIKTPKARPAITWTAGPVKLVAEMLEDGQQGEAAALAIRKCGALFFMAGSAPFMAWAPQAVEGLPECLASVRSTVVGGKWQVIHLETGRKLGFNCASRKAAEQSALNDWTNILSEEQRAKVPTMAKDHSTEDARAQYLADAGITNAEDLQAEAAPVRKAAKATAPAPVQAAPVAEVVAETIAAAQAAAVIECASEAAAVDAIATTEAEEQPRAEEVAEVVAMAEGESHQAGRALIGRVAPAQVERGQVIASKSGNWSAVFFNCHRTGLPSMRFMHSDELGRGQDGGTYESGRERMADLQRKAKAADNDAAARKQAAEDAVKVQVQAEDHAQAMPAQFERAKAQAVSLSQMIKQGIKPADLVGFGINDSGDAANPGGEGAIVSFELTQFSERVTLQLEDGREWVTQAHSFNPGSGCRFAINWKMHGRPYLAQLAAAVASRKAARTAKEETQAQAFASETDRLAAEYPYLNQVTRGGGKEAAKNVRIMLKRSFPGVKFGVTSDYSKISIKWTDGPTNAQVSEVVARFDIGRSDAQTDYFYTEGTAWSGLFGGVQYLWTSRTESPELVAAVLAQFMEGRALQATADDYIKCQGVFDWRTGDEFTRRQFTETLRSTSGSAAPKAKA